MNYWPIHQQTEAHNWLGDCAENYIAYLGACAGFEVFGAGKWGADVVLHDKREGAWWRIEVRSTDQDKRPTKKSPRKLREKAELLAEVNFNTRKRKVDLRLYSLVDGRRDHHINNPTVVEFRDFVLDTTTATRGHAT